MKPSTTIRQFATRAALVAAAAALLAAGCDSSTQPEDPEIPVPSVSAVDDTTVSPGDTITVTGTDFDENTSLNRVIFNNSLARVMPFEGSISHLRVVVPRNALSGVLTVTRAGQEEAGAGPNMTVDRGVGDVFVVGGERSIDIPTPPGAEYLIVPHATGGVPTFNHQYDLTGTELPPAAAPAGTVVDDEKTRTAIDPATQFHAQRWERGREAARRLGPPERPQPQADASAAPDQIRQFNVWNTTSPGALATDLNNYTQVTAQLRYDGTHVLVYTDVDTLTGGGASGNLTQADLNNFGQLFDDIIRPSATKYFGTESDIDGNDKVIMLITPVVNRLTPPGSSFFYGGFFFFVDLFSTSRYPVGTTNQAEIFYLLAGDPSGVWGVSQPRSFVAEENIRTIVHEYEHLISFSWRLFNAPPNSSQITWFEEGMAHMGEDLLALEAGDPTYNLSNENRGARYRVNPGGFSLEDNNSPLEQRGGMYLFLRLMGDRFGNDIYKQILQSDCIGRECLQNITGENFYDTLGDFLASMYLSGTGISSDPRVEFTSIDLSDFGSLTVAGATFDGTNVGSLVRRATGDFFVFSGSSTVTSRVTVSTPSTSMGLRTLFVRIK